MQDHGPADRKSIPTSTHWGSYHVDTTDEMIAAVRPVAADGNPSPIGQSLRDIQHPGCRVARPCIREGYLRPSGRNNGSARGLEPFVEVPWDEALDIAADAIRDVIDEYGNGAIFGGSYGWASAGRFHHSQSQLHRFLNMAGGYTSAVQSYSTGAARVIIPHVIGIDSFKAMMEAPVIEDVIANTRLIVSFGGISMKNMQINQGGIGDHNASAQLQSLSDAGVDVVCVSPVRDDVADFLQAEWLPVRPNADVALMLGLAFVLHSENLHDRQFLKTRCHGFEQFEDYLTGRSDGLPKTPQWAAALCDIDATTITSLARRMAAKPCLLSISWSLQRTEHGEQPYWMITTLAAMLGNVGAPGQGVGYGYGCIHNFGFAGRRSLPFKVGEFAQGQNPIDDYIPVARIADALLHPGEKYRFNGQTREYPDIKMIYWAGGNPFHHHQDLNRLRRAWAKPQTIIVNEPVWTATARYADIVFPASTALEREDFACGTADTWLSPMHCALPRYEQCRDDYDIFSGLAARLQFEQKFTEGRNARQWVEHLWQLSRDRAAQIDIDLPEFESFWQGGQIQLDQQRISARSFTLERFHVDPAAAPLPTPSGKIELYSETLAGFALPDCGGHARWIDKQEFIGSSRSQHWPLALNSNQPVTRLHSQLDFGYTSRAAKRNDREVARMNPADAAARGISEADVIRLFNDRGACLASVTLTENVRAGVVVLPTGSWFEPQDPTQADSLEVHGNPNVLTRDSGTSELAQATSAHSCLIQVERFQQPLPEVKIFRQPHIRV